MVTFRVLRVLRRSFRYDEDRAAQAAEGAESSSEGGSSWLVLSVRFDAPRRVKIIDEQGEVPMWF